MAEEEQGAGLLLRRLARQLLRSYLQEGGCWEGLLIPWDRLGFTQGLPHRGCGRSSAGSFGEAGGWPLELVAILLVVQAGSWLPCGFLPLFILKKPQKAKERRRQKGREKDLRAADRGMAACSTAVRVGRLWVTASWAPFCTGSRVSGHGQASGHTQVVVCTKHVSPPPLQFSLLSVASRGSEVNRPPFFGIRTLVFILTLFSKKKKIRAAQLMGFSFSIWLSSGSIQEGAQRVE